MAPRLPLAPLRSHWSLINGLPLHARVSAPLPLAGPVVVLVHGLIVSSRYMVPTAVRLAPWVATVAPDLPGFGRSPGPAATLDVPALADALAAWLLRHQLPPATVVGNSLGCQVAVDLAVRYPALVERLVLVAPTMDPRWRNPVRLVGRALLDVPRERISLIPVHLRDQLAAGPRRSWETFRYALQDHIETKLPLVAAPTLVVRGEHDPVVSQPWVEEVVRLLPHARGAVVPGGPHALNYSTPRRLVRLIRWFVAQPM